ncbi:MAG: MGMT family protein [Verrucomicrobia bacterium]|nr:MGMT family protein [Verrucomicrobiota bacterium]
MTSKPAKPSASRRLEIKTTWGPITLTLDGEKVAGCSLPLLKTAPHKEFAIDGFQTLEDLVESFPTIGNPAGTEFQKAVWREIKKIPRGQTRTYGEIAAAIGRPNAARAVGAACGANPLPLFVPCHRVVAKNGLGGFGSGLPWKTLLLTTEGAL